MIVGLYAAVIPVDVRSSGIEKDTLRWERETDACIHPVVSNAGALRGRGFGNVRG